MPVTQRGVYHNLKESKYTISNSEVVFFFSSEFTLNKFMKRHKKHREKFDGLTKFNLDVHADIECYINVEKRGFYVWLHGVEISKEELFQYSLRHMVSDNTPEWVKIERPKLNERFVKR